jgi:succinate dehydrogenase/fumarate reductase flavoprotein subunit
MTKQTSTPRRDFLKLTGVGAVAAATAAVTGTAEAARADGHPYSGPLPKKWDGTYDLVIVGGGGTGLCAAIEAVQRKLKILVIEKMPFIGGVSSMSSGYLYGAGTRLQKEQGIKDCSVDIWWKKFEDGTAWSEPLKRVRDNSLNSPIYYGITKRNQELFRNIVWEYHTLIDFLIGYGAKFAPLDQRWPFMHLVVDRTLPVVFQNIAIDLRKHGGKIITSTRANKIYLDAGGRVAGVRAVDGSGRDFNFRTRALLMASGGFLDNDKLIERYMPYWAGKGKVASAFLFSNGGAMNQQTGDGILMGLEVNASVDDMDAGFKYKIAPKNRGDAVVNGIATMQSPMLFVTPEGKRVGDERQNYTLLTMALVRAGAKHCHFVFDEAAMGTTGAKTFGFRELVEKGVIFAADTLREAAAKAGLDADGLQATVDRFNKDFDEKGVDSVFGKTGPLFQKVEKPRFYVSDKHYPVRFKTEGGLETDVRTRVLDHRTVQPIPGLYAAGSTSGTCTASLGDVMQCGRMSARYIAQDVATKRV